MKLDLVVAGVVGVLFLVSVFVEMLWLGITAFALLLVYFVATVIYFEMKSGDRLSKL